METYTLDYFPPNVGTIHIAYFENVTNAPEIRRRLVEAATASGAEGEAARSAVDFGFVEAGLLVSKQHLLTGILTALLISMPQDRSVVLDAPPVPKTRSHNIHSELLMALSPNNNITDAIRRHGVSDSTTRLVVVRYGDDSLSQEDVFGQIRDVVRGDLTSVEELDSADKPDWTRIDKVYKLGDMNQLKLKDLTERKIAAVVNTVAVKHAT